MNKIKFLRSKLKSFSDIYNGNSIPDDKKDSFVNKKIPYIATKNIDADTHQIDYENGLSVNEDDGFRIAKTKSSLLCIEGGSAGKKLGYLNQEVAFVNKLCCFTPKNIDSKFLFYSFQSSDFLSEFSLHLTGMIGGVKIGEIKNLYISYPDDLGEQHKIACFLDRKIGQIDNLISNQEKQIEKLKEYRQAIITKAVTKGLDPNVPMKDSGVEWIGKIPCNWEILRLKYCFSVRNEKYENGNYDYVALENVESFSGKYIATESNAFYSLAETIRANRNDVIFGKLRPYLSKALLIAKDCYVSSEFAVLYGLGGNRTSFLKYLLISSKFIDVINSSTYGTKMPRANIDFIRNLEIAIPDVKTQKEIVNYLDETCSKIDRLIDVKVKKIAQLSNYKKSLIYEYVTGKKRVSL